MTYDVGVIGIIRYRKSNLRYCRAEARDGAELPPVHQPPVTGVDSGSALPRAGRRAREDLEGVHPPLGKQRAGRGRRRLRVEEHLRVVPGPHCKLHVPVRVKLLFVPVPGPACRSCSSARISEQSSRAPSSLK
jgi:hypothetical protein